MTDSTRATADRRDYYASLRNSKTIQTDEPEVKPLFGLAAYALTQWLTLRGNWPGPLFYRLDATGSPIRDAHRSELSDEMVRLIELEWAERAGVDVKRLSGHSLAVWVSDPGREGRYSDARSDERVGAQDFPVGGAVLPTGRSEEVEGGVDCW